MKKRGPKPSNRIFRRLTTQPPKLPFFDGHRIVFDVEVYQQQRGEPRLPVIIQETMDDRWYVVATLEDGTRVALRGPYWVEEDAWNEFDRIKPGDLINDNTGGRRRGGLLKVGRRRKRRERKTTSTEGD